MLRRLAATTPLALAFACSTGPSAHPAPSDIAVQFNAPQALLDDVQSVNLYIVEAAAVGIACDESTGMIAAPDSGTGLIPTDIANPKLTVEFPLVRTAADAPCPNDGVFCSPNEIVLPTAADKPLVFQAVGLAGGAPLAVGCTTAAVNSDPFYVSLSMLRYVAPAVCGDGALQVGEQCEGVTSDDDVVCDNACHTKEVLLSTDHFGPANINITNAPAGSKSGVALAWSLAPEAANPSPLHAVFEDTNFGATGTGPEVNYRQVGQDAYPISFPPLLSSQIRLPLDGGSIPGFDQRPRAQTAPAIATMTDGSFVVAYEDDRSSNTGQVNISFTAISVDIAAPHSDEIYINTTGVDACSDPTVAGGPNDRALVAWTDNAGRRVRGRLWSKTGWLSSSDSTFSATDGDTPRAAGWNEGWIVVWHGRSAEDNDDIVLVQVDANGTVGAPVVVNEQRAGVQDKPAIAALPNGSFAVVWNDTGRIMLQRFDASAQPVVGDQLAAIDDVSASVEDNPTIAASPLALGFYAVAWQTASGEIRARLIDRTGGYLFNSVDGQATSFSASRVDIAGNRTRPAVAIGGAGHIVFAWQDDAPDHSGIYARRFPLPAR